MNSFFMKKLFLTSLASLVLLFPAYSSAATPVKKAAKPTPVVIQPKIVKVDYTVKAKSTGPFTDTLVWPKEAGTLIEIPSDASLNVIVNSQIAKNKKLRWAFVSVWSDTQPAINTMLPTAAAVAQKNLTKSKFSAYTKSPTYKTGAKNIGKYLTVYSFITNNDKITSAPNFPLFIDYASAVTFIVVDAASYAEEEKPTTKEVVKKEPEKTKQEPAKNVPPPQIGEFSAYKLVNSPYGATSKSSSHTLGKFEIKTTIASYLKSVKISIEGTFPKDKNRAITVYRSQTASEANKLASATFGDLASDGTLTLTFKEPQAVYVSEPLVLTFVGDTGAAISTSWIQLNVYGGLTSVDKTEKLQAFPVGGGKLIFGNPNPDVTVVTPPVPPTEPAAPTSTPVTTESLAVTAKLAANSPGGATSKSSSQVLAKFILFAPQSKSATIEGVTIVATTENFAPPSEERRYAHVYKTETLTELNKIGETSVQSIMNGTVDAYNGYIKFAKPLTIEAGTSQFITITANTTDAVSNSIIVVELFDVKRIPETEGDAVVSDKINLSGKKLYY